MKLIKPKAEYLPQASGLEGVYKQIEKCGRTCYRSEDKITEDSSKPFVDRMINSHHTAMLEQGTVYLRIPVDDYSIGRYHHKGTIIASQFEVNPYSKLHYGDLDDIAYVTTNYRALLEYFDEDDVEFILNNCLCEPTEFHEKRHTFKLTTSIGVSRELIRHRTMSFAEQSTRYCNFSKDKFNNQVSFCIPEWLGTPEGTYNDIAAVREVHRNKEEKSFYSALYESEIVYKYLTRKGWQPQQAREVLPLCTATEIVVTGFASDWRHFFDLRLFEKTGKVHPNMKQLAELMRVEAEKAGIWEDIMNQSSKFE